MKTVHPIRALLLVLTFGLSTGACFAQAADNQAPDSQASDSQTPNNQAPDKRPPGYQMPGNQAPDYQAPDNGAPDNQMSGNQAPDYQAPDNRPPDYQTSGNQAPDYQTSNNQASDGEVSVASAPPPLPSYEQPPVPGPGYQWTPGYWGYGAGAGYYWVPGTWVLPPAIGLLWTPGYWGWRGGAYFFHRGWWGPRVGFYGGINYGCGYFGFGFAGGYWRGREFFYNRAVTNIRNTSIRNVYNAAFVNRGFGNSRISHNGGPGGVNLRPTAVDQAAARAARYAPTNAQRNHEWAARGMPALRASVNHGQPPIAATARPGIRGDQDVAAQRHDAENRAASINRASDRPPSATRGVQHDTAQPQQLQRNRASITQPVAASRPAPGVRSVDMQRSQANIGPSARPPAYQATVGAMHTARQGYDYARAAHQPAANWTAPARPAPGFRYAQRVARAPTYMALAPQPTRARAPTGYRANSAPTARAGTQSASHGPRHG